MASAARSRYAEPIAGQPWFRVFRGWHAWPVDSGAADRRIWLRAAADLAGRVLATELRNMPESLRPTHLARDMATCADAAIAALASGPDADWLALRAAARLPDDYSLTQRVVGAYPLTSLGLRHGIARWRAEFLADYGAPLPGPVRDWVPGAASDHLALARTLLAEVPRLPGLSLPDAATLARWLVHHGPAWRLHGRAPADQPGWPIWDGGALALDVSQPDIAVQLLPAIVRGRAHLQLIFTLWLAGRPADGRIDPYSGALDGVVWRVTLDADGGVVMRDAMHPCGCYHMLFPPHPVRVDASLGEPALVPQVVADGGPLTVVVRGGDHQIKGVRAGRATDATVYDMRPYTDVLSLPVRGEASAVTRRSLFDRDGLVGASRRSERFFLWPSGVASAGAMRVWGHHAVAFVGRRHADDADLFGRLLLDFRAE